MFLVGAGPGSAAYLTQQAQQCLQRADALVYDALVDPGLLALLPPTCGTFAVGKRGGQPSTPQAEINRLLVDLAYQGKTVVRLKSGDPFIFGRTTAEIQALRAAGCDFVVVPGLSAALAAPLLAGIPLTDPVLSRGFGVFTAHDLSALDWGAIARWETLVFLMAGRQLTALCDRLRQGRSPETPVAVVRWAGQAQQQVWTGTLLSIVQITRGQTLSPCVVVVGEVVRLRDYLHSPAQHQAPLAGETVLVTRAAGQSSQFSDLLVAQGAQVVEMPALEIVAASDPSGLDRALAQLSDYDWLVLTSANAVEFFLDRLMAQSGKDQTARKDLKDLRSLAHLKIAVVGKKTAKVLGQRGLVADFIPSDYVADALVETFPAPLAGLRVLFPRVERGGRPVLVEAFRARDARVDEVAAYDSVCPGAIAPAAAAALAAGQITMLTFASSKTVGYFAQLMAQAFGESWRERLDGVRVASIGPQTSIACREILGRVDLEATEYTLEGLTQALVEARS